MPSIAFSDANKISIAAATSLRTHAIMPCFLCQARLLPRNLHSKEVHEHFTTRLG